ncbi:ergosterol biosynthesis ERG4/ERG24 [Naematelia encephala]|uniref:Delta(14)-sterol reductase ERG24 n=1 Tax=Naematelia encephala TaxID=71784 RepID=A0A1Y2BCH7_9TREE|nr:ergosterol biosynthesis ERG4/ERG24 [Naematelia encephala]
MAKKTAAPSGGETTTTITATTTLTLPANTVPLTYDQLNPKSIAHEFLGPIGTGIVTFLAPAFAYILFYTCNEATGCPPTSSAAWSRLGSLLGDWPTARGQLWDWKAAGVYLAWYLFCVAAWAILPGQWVEGNLLRNGTRNKYKENGFLTFVLAAGLSAGVLIQPGGIERFTYLYDHWIPLVSASLVMATAQAVWVYVWSFFSGELLALGGNSGWKIYDFFLGRPLNPVFPGFPSFDIKTFNEVRPGIILWVLLNVSCACEQYVRFGKISDSMWLVVVFEGYYAIDCLWNEMSILNQMDITTDGFGFMLSFGDLTWLPFTYGLQARYLAFHPVTLGPVWTSAIIALEVVGLWIFRSSNNEKGDFRNGKNPKNLTYMETERGTRLLTSGWWGRSRHPNYLGDWLMAWAWCLPVGLTSPIPYFYVAYFAVLLVHRQMRDDEACKNKYGKDWDKYCKIVPYRIIPYIY